MSGNWLKMGIISLGLVLALPAVLMAQSQPTTKLDTVVVTSNRTEESLREVTSNITVIDEQTIQRSPGATLDSILRREGIHIMEYPGQGTAAVEMRGIRQTLPVETGGLGSRNLLLIDGRPAGTGNVAAVTKTNIERIEIIRGPAALAYGSQAMAGVVNVITKRGTGDFSGHMQAGFGSWSYQDQEGGVDGRAGSVDYSLGLFHSRSDSYKTGGGFQSTGSDYKGIYSGSTNLGYNFLDDRHRIGLTTRFFYNELQGTGNALDYPSEDSNIKLENESFDLSYAGKNEAESLSWQLRYFRYNDKYFSYDDRDQISATYSNKIESDGLQGQLTADFGPVELTSGLDWQKYDVAWDSIYNNPSLNTADMSNIGAYVLGKLKLLDDNLIFTGGLRYDSFDSKVQGENKTVDNWAPTVGVAYFPIEWLKLRANAGRGFRTPTPYELGLNYTSIYGGPPYIGNPTLDPEYSTNYEVGFDVDYDPSWTVGLTYFHTDYKNRIEGNFPVTIGGQPYRTYQNSDSRSTTAGFEMNASFDIGSYLDWPVQLEPYVKATYYTQRKGYYEPIDLSALIRVPKSTITYGFDFEHPDWGLFVNLNATYFGTMMDVEWDGNIYANVPREVSSHTLVDLTVEKVLAEFADKHKVSAKFAVKNMFDKDYVSYPGYPSPGASVYFGLKYDFN